MSIAELERELQYSAETYHLEECAAFAQLLETDLRLLERIRTLENDWLSTLRAGAARFDFGFDRNITQQYRQWVAHAEVRLRQLEMQEAKGCSPGPAGTFRDRLEEAREILGERLRDERVARERAILLAENGDR